MSSFVDDYGKTLTNESTSGKVPRKRIFKDSNLAPYDKNKIIKMQLKSTTKHDFSDAELEKILELGKSEHGFTSDQTLSYFLESPPRIYGRIEWDKTNNVISPYEQGRMDANQPGINVSGFSFASYFYDDGID